MITYMLERLSSIFMLCYVGFANITRYIYTLYPQGSLSMLDLATSIVLFASHDKKTYHQ